MDMKKLLESMDNIEECGTNEGMPMVPPMPPQPEEDKGNPVSMNVSMNASGKEHVADLINMMKNAGMSDAKPVTPDMMPMRRDMERLRDIVDAPMDDPKIPGKDDMPGDRDVTDMGCNDDIEMDDEAVAEYDNEPDEQYGSIDDIIDTGDDLHKSKKAYPATQDGDNPMSVEDETTYAIRGKSPEAQEELARKASEEATLESSIKEELWAKLSNMKFDEGRGRGKKKAKEDIKTTEGRGKVMASRGRGKDKLMAGRGRGKKK